MRDPSHEAFPSICYSRKAEGGFTSAKRPDESPRLGPRPRTNLRRISNQVITNVDYFGKERHAWYFKAHYALSLLATDLSSSPDTFLPFHLDFCVSSASVLIVVDDILCCAKVETSSKYLAKKLLDEMISRGNRAASLRQNELRQLQAIAVRLGNSSRQQFTDHNSTYRDTDGAGLHQLANVAEWSRSAPSILSSSDRQPGLADTWSLLTPHDTEDPLLDHTPQDLAGDASSSASILFARDFDLSHEHMLDIASKIDTNALGAAMRFEDFGGPFWLGLEQEGAT